MEGLLEEYNYTETAPPVSALLSASISKKEANESHVSSNAKE
jgi:hypothetical protein